MFVLDTNCKLSDLYRYVIQFYSHITEPILLYLDSKRKIMIPNNDILLESYLREKKIVSFTDMSMPVVYKFYLDLCCINNQINNQNYSNIK
tara:strand:- start:15838 stop:16110 length:273 start_codon:yes stop_codon:yes gene_type:complete